MSNKPAREVLTLADAESIAQAVNYPLRLKLGRLVHLKAEIAQAEEEMKGVEVNGIKITPGVLDSLMEFMTAHALPTIVTEDGVQVSLEDGRSNTLSKELLLKNGVTVEQITASTMERLYKKLVVRVGKRGR